MKTTIIIPSRYGSTRFPGKPLALIAGKTMLQRVVELARAVSQQHAHTDYCVATDDERIGAHCDVLGAPWVLTPPECPTGSDRMEAAVRQLASRPDFVVNLQGDAPLTPSHFLSALLNSFLAEPCDVVTPVTRLSWEDLDALRESKKRTPFTGTTAVFDAQSGNAFWFSKQILPAVRNEAELRANSRWSPVYRHVGLYGYSRAMLSRFVELPVGQFEKLEGLEQLRILENGHRIRCVPVEAGDAPSMTGIDSPEDIQRAEQLLANRSAP